MERIGCSCRGLLNATIHRFPRHPNTQRVALLIDLSHVMGSQHMDYSGTSQSWILSSFDVRNHDKEVRACCILMVLYQSRICVMLFKSSRRFNMPGGHPTCIQLSVTFLTPFHQVCPFNFNQLS